MVAHQVDLEDEGAEVEGDSGMALQTLMDRVAGVYYKVAVLLHNIEWNDIGKWANLRNIFYINAYFKSISLRGVLNAIGYLGITGMVRAVAFQEVIKEEAVEEEVDLEILVHLE